MHEIGSLYKLIEQVIALALENNVEKVTAINIEVGQLSGILPFFLRKYYPFAIDGHPLLADSELIIKEIPAEGICKKCHMLYNIVKTKGLCPKCNSRERITISGRDFILKNIVVEERESNEKTTNY